MSKMEYRGLYVEKCCYERQHEELIDSVRISLSNINVISNQPIVHLTYKIQLVYPKSLGEIIITAYFVLEDNEFKDEIIKKSNEVNGNNDSITKETTLKIMSMMHVSFPYVRNVVENLTRDSSGAVTLPIIDIQQLFENELEFNRKKN